MSNAEDLDEALRAKLRAAAEREPVPERPERHAQWTAALAREQRAALQRRRVLRGVLAGGIALAAVALLLVWRAANGDPQLRASSDARCALPEAVSVQTDASGTQRIVLGRLGALAATADSTLRVESSDPCLLALELERGELAGDLSQLKPAVLRVRTPQATVVVRGTRFSVRADDALEVVLLSGRVEVEDGETRVLEPQHVLQKRGAAWNVRRVQAEEAPRVARILAGERPELRDAGEAAPSPVGVAAPATASAREPEKGSAPAHVSSGELLARAETARRQGLSGRARSLYAQASAQADADAEVALLRWVRLELAAHAFDEAARVLAQHRQRFASGKLKAEAAWLGVVLLQDRGDLSGARDAARAFVTSFPSAPQADAARALLKTP
jgi:ferric-dicitrate binding protein FerR (iron transport regulator)